jgi:hypothetical protein
VSIKPLLGRPQVGAETQVTHRVVSRQGFWTFLANGLIVDGLLTRDPGNSADSTRTIRPGTLMGKVTASGRYANSVIGVSTGAIIATATEISVSAAAAAEIVRRIGATGTLRFVGPPTAAGTVATFTETYSAVNTSTGAITIAAADAALVAGSLVCANDGSYLPLTVVPDGYGLLIPEDSSHTEWPLVPIAGVIDFPQLLPAVTDASLKTWIRTNLSTVSGGKFTFSDLY